MNKTAITVAAMLCVTAAGISHWHAYAGPLEPPAGPVASTSPSLADIEAQIQTFATPSCPQPGLQVAGYQIGSVPINYETLISGQGTIRKILVNHNTSGGSNSGVEILVDGSYAGYFRPSISSGPGNGVAFMPVYEVDLAFGSSVQVRVAADTGQSPVSVSIHYELESP